jgi:hypothetical protein
MNNYDQGLAKMQEICYIELKFQVNIELQAMEP